MTRIRDMNLEECKASIEKLNQTVVIGTLEIITGAAGIGTGGTIIGLNYEVSKELVGFQEYAVEMLPYGFLIAGAGLLIKGLMDRTYGLDIAYQGLKSRLEDLEKTNLNEP